MTDRKLSLPPFAALRAFYAVATHERYRDAADSLGVTESAISHQIRGSGWRNSCMPRSLIVPAHEAH